MNKELLAQVKKNIAASIGVAFEIIGVDNTIHPKSIASIYNDCAKTASFDFLCFIHEDVIIHSKDWGKNIITLLSEKSIGLVGVSGAIYKSKFAGTWSAVPTSLYRTHSIQHFKNSPEPLVSYINPGNASSSEVAVIDGVFMATRKDVFKEMKFDENLFTGFHGYDLDYSLQVGKKYKIQVTYDVVLEHFSEGNLNGDWLKYSLLLHKKWRNSLPVKSEVIDQNLISLSDYMACSLVLRMTIKHAGSKLTVFKYYCLLLIYFAKFNRLKHTKAVLNYLLFSWINAA